MAASLFLLVCCDNSREGPVDTTLPDSEAIPVATETAGDGFEAEDKPLERTDFDQERSLSSQGATRSQFDRPDHAEDWSDGEEEDATPSSRAASPKGNPGSWANANDYPSGPLRREEEGVSRFRVEVDPAGRVASCEITGSSGSSELDSTACALITRRGRFNPATDENGDPIAGSWSSSINWQIPRD